MKTTLTIIAVIVVVLTEFWIGYFNGQSAQVRAYQNAAKVCQEGQYNGNFKPCDKAQADTNTEFVCRVPYQCWLEVK